MPTTATQEMPDIMTVKDVSERLDVPAPTLYVWLQKGLLPHTTVGGGRYLFTAEHVQEIAYVLHNYGREALLDGFAMR